MFYFPIQYLVALKKKNEEEEAVKHIHGSLIITVLDLFRPVGQT
jgi:hypothetical protein